MISYLVVIAKLDDLAHTLHQGIQILGLRMAATQRGDRGDEITFLSRSMTTVNFLCGFTPNSRLEQVYHGEK